MTQICTDYDFPLPGFRLPRRQTAGFNLCQSALSADKSTHVSPSRSIGVVGQMAA